ncbi:MAG: hydroxysqualene dehydroxylase HpnE, partial [Phycisphaeraceae bacterium]|nr:hydroxysqualene dehydroxylase HpnE [Phycisphaeraceae bacterium]
DDDIVWTRSIFFAGEDGAIDRVDTEDLPAPFHNAAGFAGVRFLTWGDKIKIALAMRRIMLMGPEARLAMAGTSFADWLTATGQSQRAIDRFWAPVIESACNEKVDRTDARYGLQVFAEGFLPHPRAGEMGLPSVPLVALYDAAEPAIEAAGGRLRLRTSVAEIGFADGVVTGITTRDGGEVVGDAYVSALPPDRLAKVIGPAMVESDDRLARLEEFDHSPIIGIHLFYDRPVTELPHVAQVTGKLQWLFNRGWDAEVGGHHLHGVISAAHELVDQPAEAILEQVLADAAVALPAAADAELVHHRVVKEKRATFSVLPGIDALRPPAAGTIENLALAGDWCDTGWPATMEGATRSGYLAADAVIEHLG